MYAAVMAMPIIPPGRMLGALAACKRFSKSWSGYHRRSLVNTKMYCIKRLGERVMSRTFERLVNKLHIRAAILNRFPEPS